MRNAVLNISRKLVLTLGLATLLVSSPNSLAQETKTQSIDLGGLTIEVPGSWERVRPSSSMRRAELQIPAAEGDEKPGNLAVFVFPQGAGTVEANVQRWQQQFQGEDGQPPEVESETVRGQNVDVARVEVAGTYVEPPFSGGGKYENYRLLGAIVETDQGAYFFKLVGPDSTILSAEEGFDAMISSMKVAP